MQAQPQSTLAARIFSAPPTAAPLPNPSRSTPPLPAPRSTPSLANNIGLAHDAGNLLSALGLYSDLLSVPGVLRPEHQHYATELRLISDRSSKLIQHLLTNTPQSAPSSSDTSTQPASNHASTLHNLAPVLERIAAGAATVSVACPATLPALDFPADIIERITVNLVRNAAEAIRLHRAIQPPSISLPPGEIYVTLAVIAGRVQLTVQDNGPGMPPAIAAAYLQPSPLPQGATRGLGHRIIHELATSSEGQLSIRVRPGFGTTFCVKWTIPASNMLTEPCSLLADPLRRIA
jgi:C4-dicarboxylate-specific signal transduction histidine kinase